MMGVRTRCSKEVLVVAEAVQSWTRVSEIMTVPTGTPDDSEGVQIELL